MRRIIAIAALATFSALPVSAGSATVVDVRADEGAGGWRFDVTVAHADTGWDHYADGWYILAPDGTELGYRELLHPHVDEQPFTRSLSNVAIPDGLTQVLVRANDSVHGPGEAVVYPLPGR